MISPEDYLNQQNQKKQISPEEYLAQHKVRRFLRLLL